MTSDWNNWSAFAHLFVRSEIPAKTTLLQEGKTAHSIYFVERGCLRLWFNHAGKDITFQFFLEGEGVSSIESFRAQQPSLFSLECIEPTAVWALSRENFLAILEEAPHLRAEVEEQIFQRLLFYQRLFLSRIKHSPQERYEELLRDRPEIVRRIPQHYIASYLGITSVSLSRIRNRR